MTQRQKVIFIAVFIIIGFLASVAYHFFVAYILKLNYYPYNTFLFRPSDRFGDFLDNFNAGHDAYRKVSATRAMFPLFVVLCRIMYSINFRLMHLINVKMLLLILYLVGFLLCLSFYILYSLRQCSAGLRYIACGSMLVSFPVLISLDRANFENGIFLLVALSVGLLIKKKYILAALMLGIASALKPYSAIFFLLFLIDEQFLAIISGAGAWGLSTILSLLVLPTPLPIELHNLQASMDVYNQHYVVGNSGMYFGNSLFGLIKFIVYLIGDQFHLFSTKHAVLLFIQFLMEPYMLITLAAALVILVILFVYKTPLWQKVAIVVFCMNLLPYIGGGYRLLYLFIPLLMFLAFEEKDKLDMVYFNFIWTDFYTERIRSLFFQPNLSDDPWCIG